MRALVANGRFGCQSDNAMKGEPAGIKSLFMLIVLMIGTIKLFELTDEDVADVVKFEEAISLYVRRKNPRRIYNRIYNER